MAVNSSSNPTAIGCEKCDGFGNIVTPQGVQVCECKLLAASAGNLASAGIPPMYLKKDFDTYKNNTASRKRMLEYGRKYVDSYEPGKKGLLFMGTCGTGKTHLAVSILKGLIQKGYTGAFYNVITLLDDLRASYALENSTSQWPIIERIVGVQILVLDDLGAEKTSGWVNDRLYAIINQRYEQQKTIIVTTNREIPDLKEQVGYRIYSRLMEMCQTQIFEGQDYRIEMMRSGKS